jgi:hypothetical protein
MLAQLQHIQNSVQKKMQMKESTQKDGYLQLDVLFYFYLVLMLMIDYKDNENDDGVEDDKE